MPRKCILCEADEELRSSIEQFVNEGNSYVDAAKFAKEHGLDISHTSIQRHIENHTQIEYVTQNTGENNYQMEVIAEPINFEKIDDLDQFIGEKLKKLIVNLTVICEEQTKRYMMGEARFPKEEIRTLHGTYAMLNKKGEVFSTVTEAEL
jgi:uncharacterized protein with ParB-like and HNH nuclease domain